MAIALVAFRVELKLRLVIRIIIGLAPITFFRLGQRLQMNVGGATRCGSRVSEQVAPKKRRAHIGQPFRDRIVGQEIARPHRAPARLLRSRS